MPKASPSNPVLLQWTKHVPSSDVQDPLGTTLRGATRLASRLLYCITSITPRARYFAFIPWCVYDYGKREKGLPHALGLREAIYLREQAFTLGCVAHHNGQPCQGGTLVGSRQAVRWFEGHSDGEADFRHIRFVKNPALDAYFNSLVNLGMFVTDEDLPDADATEEQPERTFNDIELSALGHEVANRYDSLVGSLSAVKSISQQQRRCPVYLLKSWGERGCLCGLSAPSAPERQLLRDIFFYRINLKGESHVVRRRSLLLILELCRVLSDADWVFNGTTFAESVYYGETEDEGERFVVKPHEVLDDISIRWRMFYFHYYMAVALEGVFAWLVSRLVGFGLTGESMDRLTASLAERAVRTDMSRLCGFDIGGRFSDLSPAGLFSRCGLPAGELDERVSVALGAGVRSGHPLAENSLEDRLRSDEYRASPTGLAISLVALTTILGRYKRWERTNYGDWLASAAVDPYVDLVPPVLLDGLERRFGDWWNCPYKELGAFVLSRYVIQQHQAMSFEKTQAGDRCLLQVDGSRVFASGAYDKIGIVNARFRSGVRVLVDLGLLERNEEDGDITLTREGRSFLKPELAKEADQ